jgi:hypothetical protein
MPSTLPVPYTPALARPDGWYWHCAWCGAVATDPEVSWDAAIDALMDAHTPDCAAYQMWLKAVNTGTKKKVRKRRKRPGQQLAFFAL